MRNIIKINIKKKDDYISKFNYNILSNELREYIMEECKGYSLNSDISIEVSSEYDMDDMEKEKIVDMIRATFGTEISEMLIFRKKNIIIDFLMILFGALSLIFYLLSSNIPILSEVILIFSWILIGESVYNLIFNGVSDKIMMERKRKLTNCEIIFKKSKNS
jgi:hypothetical protein